MKFVLFHGVTAGLAAALACIVYDQVYTFALAVDFSAIVKPVGLIASCLFATLLASAGYFFFRKWVRKHTDTWFNLIFTILTFASFIGPLTTTLPLDVQAPELFIGLTMPMHLFPQLFWLVTKPMFRYQDSV